MVVQPVLQSSSGTLPLNGEKPKGEVTNEERELSKEEAAIYNAYYAYFKADAKEGVATAEFHFGSGESYTLQKEYITRATGTTVFCVLWPKKRGMLKSSKVTFKERTPPAK